MPESQRARRWWRAPASEPPCTYRSATRLPAAAPALDVMVPMRDGVRLCVDIFRPETDGKVPALLAISPYNKALPSAGYAGEIPPQPAWSTLWAGSSEAGDTDFLVARGYAHVIGTTRGAGQSEGGGDGSQDLYDLIEWIAAQPWCNGRVGMVGISAFGSAQLQAAALAPPSLKAIFPYDPGPAYREFRDRNPGGVLHTFPLTIDAGSVAHGSVRAPGALDEAGEARAQEALANPDYRMHHQIWNIVTMKGQKAPVFYKILTEPYDSEAAVARAEAMFDKVRVPTYLGTGWYAQTYKSHFQGAQHWFRGLDVTRKFVFTGPAQLPRPFRSLHHEIVRWYDHWLKDVDTGVTDEPAVKVYVMGANRWTEATDWPVPETRWTPFYLDSWERLRDTPFEPDSRESTHTPDAFVQMPPTLTRSVAKLRYCSEPLAQDLLVMGPISLTLFAEIDQPDTNWIVVLKDVGPDYGEQTARAHEMALPTNLPEREISRGWLKASYRALDPARSKPWKPWHRLTREARQPAVPGEVTEYRIELMATANLFRRGHRICLEIMSADMPTGVGGHTHAETMPFHLCSAATTLHKVYRDVDRPSHLLLPVVPYGRADEEDVDAVA